MTAPLPTSEEERLQELYRYDILDTGPERAFDDITQLAAQICGTPLAFVSLVDRDRQWFKAQVGADIEGMPRAMSFCAHAILETGLTQITDTTLDDRFRDHPFVIGEPHLRFYAGTPLLTGGSALGTLCVLDRVPRLLSGDQQAALKTLGRIVVAQLDLRRTAAEREQDLTKHARTSDTLHERERQLQAITDNVPLLIARVGPDFRYRFANRVYQDVLHIPPEQAIGHTMHEVLGEVAFAGIRPYAERALAGERVSFTSRVDFRTIGPRHTHATYIPEFGPGGAVTGFLVSVLDITDRQHAETALRERTALLENVLSTIPLEVFWKDRASTYLGCNTKFARAAGLDDPADILGKTDTDLTWTPEEAEEYRADDRRVIETGTASLDMEESYRHADGTITTGLTSKVPLRDAGGHIIGVLGVSQDISERKALEDEREHLLTEMERLLAEAVERADHDPLTGLLNHRVFQQRLEVETDRARREGTPLAVVLFDLANFRFFNEAYGHPAGDDVLRRIATGLRRRCRPEDTAARFGGDRFALLMPGLTPSEATHQARHIADSLSQQGYTPPGHDVSVPLKLTPGVAVFPTEADDRQGTLDLAAARLRVAKTGGEDAVAEALSVRAAMAHKVEGFSMLDALVAAVDNKDRYTRRHSEDVLAYSLEIAQQLGMDEVTRTTVAVAALLHDVGKIGVPDKILRKPGRLTEEEFQAMRQHPMMGAIIVGAVPGFEETLDAVRHHHERWDGGGYPFGLRGEETPLMARLMAVADAFSAMTTDRPYRKGITMEKALTILRDGAGTQWDPACVQAFLETRRGSENP